MPTSDLLPLLLADLALLAALLLVARRLSDRPAPPTPPSEPSLHHLDALIRAYEGDLERVRRERDEWRERAEGPGANGEVRYSGILLCAECGNSADLVAGPTGEYARVCLVCEREW